MSAIQSNTIINLVCQSAVVIGLGIAYARVTKMVMKSLTSPQLDFDGYDIGMLVLDIGLAVYTKDMLIKHSILPAEITK